MRNTEVLKFNQQNTITKGLLGFQGVLGSHQTFFANSAQDFKGQSDTTAIKSSFVCPKYT